MLESLFNKLAGLKGIKTFTSLKRESNRAPAVATCGWYRARDLIRITNSKEP